MTSTPRKNKPKIFKDSIREILKNTPFDIEAFEKIKLLSSSLNIPLDKNLAGGFDSSISICWKNKRNSLSLMILDELNHEGNFDSSIYSSNDIQEFFSSCTSEELERLIVHISVHRSQDNFDYWYAILKEERPIKTLLMVNSFYPIADKDVLELFIDEKIKNHYFLEMKIGEINDIDKELKEILSSMTNPIFFKFSSRTEILAELFPNNESAAELRFQNAILGLSDGNCAPFKSIIEKDLYDASCEDYIAFAVANCNSKKSINECKKTIKLKFPSEFNERTPISIKNVYENTYFKNKTSLSKIVRNLELMDRPTSSEDLSFEHVHKSPQLLSFALQDPDFWRKYQRLISNQEPHQIEKIAKSIESNKYIKDDIKKEKLAEIQDSIYQKEWSSSFNRESNHQNKQKSRF